ncbi:MAG: hypothetical protein EA401_12395, partial [Planctomycetota bacterium]
MSDQDSPANDPAHDPTLSDDQRLAKLIAASLDAEEDALGEGRLTLPDSLQDDASEESPASVSQDHPNDSDENPSSPLDPCEDGTQADDESALSWSDDADNRPLVTDDDDEDQLRQQIN